MVTADSFEQTLRSVEKRMGLSLTLHDMAGAFHTPAGKPLFPHRRESHQKLPVCLNGFSNKCLDHCRYAVNARAGRERESFVHFCWKGLQEVVVPIERDGEFLGSLFGGIWRHRQRRRMPYSPPLPRAAVEAYHQLDPFPKDQFDTLSSVLKIVAKGLVHMLDELHASHDQPEAGAATRRAEIQRFLRARATEPVRLTDLAKALHLSPSRTSHLVQEIFGQPFQNLLKVERLNRAKTLLLTTDYPVGEIAERLGMPDEFYFNHFFKKATGLPPGRFRQQHRLASS